MKYDTLNYSMGVWMPTKVLQTLHPTRRWTHRYIYTLMSMGEPRMVDIRFLQIVHLLTQTLCISFAWTVSMQSDSLLTMVSRITDVQLICRLTDRSQPGYEQTSLHAGLLHAQWSCLMDHRNSKTIVYHVNPSVNFVLIPSFDRRSAAYLRV